MNTHQRSGASSSFLPAIPYIAAAFTTVMGGAAFIGWMIDSELLKGFGGSITMKANMAIGLIASGLALACRASSRRFRMAATTLASLAGALGALTFAEHLFAGTCTLTSCCSARRQGRPAPRAPAVWALMAP